MSPPAKRSLVVAPQWIGDAVMSEPLLARLAARGEQLTVAALPWVAPVYRAMPQVHEVLEWPFAHGRLDGSTRWRIAAELRGCFDAAYVLPNSLKAALIPWLARIPQRVGYHGEGRVLLLNRRLPNPAGRAPMVEFYDALAGPHDAACAAPAPRLHIDAQIQARATAAAGVSPGAYWVFAPGAEYGPAKCWPAAHYAALARSLFQRDGLPVLLLGSGKEAALCEAIAVSSGSARLPRARRQDRIVRRDGADRRRARPGQQRLGFDARRCSVRHCAGGRVRLDQPAAHAALEPQRPGAVAEGRTATRLRALLRAQLPVWPHALPDRTFAAAC